MAAACSAGLMAEVTEIVTLRNGNTYSGRIWMQLSNGEIGFKADTSVVYLPSSEIDRIVRHPVRKGETRQFADIYRYTPADTVVVVETVPVDTVLTDSAVAAVDFTEGYSDTVASEVAMEDVFVDDVTVADVIRGVELLEEGSIVKYRDVTPRDITLNTKDIRLISRPPRDPAQINGLLDEIVTKSGQTYNGYIISTEPGKSVRINDDGRVYSILFSDIDVQRKVAADPSQPLFCQSPVVDNVYLRKDGVLLDVVLIEQNYGKGSFDVIDRNNVVTRRPLANIRKIRKEVNREYKPVREFAFKQDSLYINREVVTAVDCKRKGSKIQVKLGNTMLRSFVRDHGCITFEGEDNLANKRLILVPIVIKNSEEVEINNDDLVEKSVPVTEQSVDAKKNILCRRFAVAPGHYAFVNTEGPSVIVFRVR